MLQTLPVVRPSGNSPIPRVTDGETSKATDDCGSQPKAKSAEDETGEPVIPTPAIPKEKSKGKTKQGDKEQKGSYPDDKGRKRGTGSRPPTVITVIPKPPSKRGEKTYGLVKVLNPMFEREDTRTTAAERPSRPLKRNPDEQGSREEMLSRARAEMASTSRQEYPWQRTGGVKPKLTYSSLGLNFRPSKWGSELSD